MGKYEQQMGALEKQNKKLTEKLKATVPEGKYEAEKEKHQQQMGALEKQNKKLTEKLKAAKSEVKELLAAKGENTSLQQKLEVAVAEADGLRKRLAIRAEPPATGEADGEDARLR